MQMIRFLLGMRTALVAAAAVALSPLACAQHENGDGADEGAQRLATGQWVTPTAPSGAIDQPLNPGLPAYPNFVAGEAVRSRLSPDGATLAIICSGQNSLYKPDVPGVVDVANSTQYIFLYDVSGDHKTHPKLSQVIQQPNAYVGLVWSHDGNALYAAGGNDDAVYVYTRSGGALVAAGTIALGHSSTHQNKGIGLGVQPNAGGLDISADDKTLVVANNYNDSISVVDTATRTVRYEHDLRPFFVNNEGSNGASGGTFPFAVAIKGNGTAYVSSDRDREIVVVDVSSPSAGHLIKRIKLDGNGLGMTFNKSQARLYVAQDNADEVAIIDTASNRVVDRIDARAPAGMLSGPQRTGAATFAVTLSPDEKTLYAVNAGANSIAVIPLAGSGSGGEGEDGLDRRVAGLIPTAYDPHDITLSADGTWMYIINGKSVTGPNTLYRFGNTALLTSVTYPGGNAAAIAQALSANQYQFQLERASLVSAPVPDSAELAKLTQQVARNNGYASGPNAGDQQVMEFLRDRIQHVIYVVKENRTFDQMLGDLTNGANVDPSLNLFGNAITPNFHRMANDFVTLDNFMDPGDGSMDGWSWAMTGRVTNTETITQQINYARVNRGVSYESEGQNRNIPVGLATVAQRDAATNGGFSAGAASLPGGPANLLAGIGNHAAPDASFGYQEGYIFDAVLKAGKTVRNYGFMVNSIGSIGTIAAPVSDPFAAGIVQVAPENPALIPLTDLYFRGYDQNYPDVWRYNEWKREFDQFVAHKNLPALTLFRVSHDHTGSFGTALAGVNTPETQQADDDLATGRMVEAVAHSPYAGNTVIIITEDDCQDGPDHVDSHRATAYIVGAYVKQHAVVSTRYSQINALRTIEDILGAP
ncbi:MAG TPA: alkaline phosphatase family protein, partial [Burkholderiaceae bacterium]